MGVVGTGWAKLLLFGEHAAVYGHPAVGIALEQCTRVRLEPGRAAAGPNGVSEWRPPPSADQPQLRRLIERFCDIAPELRATGGTLRISSSIPREVGFGSSSALCVALSDAFHGLLSRRQGLGLRAGPREAALRTIWGWAHAAEGLFHGTPSGIDTGLSLHRGLCSFVPHPPALPDWRRLPGCPLFLVVGAVPRGANTGELVSGLRKRVEQGDGEAVERLERLGAAARRAIDLLSGTHGDSLLEIGGLARQAQDYLRSLELSTPLLDELLAEGERAGALGGKLSGAGGGGAFFLVSPDERRAEKVRRRTVEILRERAEGVDAAARAAAVQILGWRRGELSEREKRDTFPA